MFTRLLVLIQSMRSLVGCDRHRQIVRRTALRSLLVHGGHEIRVHTVVLDVRIHVELNGCYGRSNWGDGLHEGEGLRISQDRSRDVRGPINVEGADLAKVRVNNLAWETPGQRNSLRHDEARCAGAESAAGVSSATHRYGVCANEASRWTDG